MNHSDAQTIAKLEARLAEVEHERDQWKHVCTSTSPALASAIAEIARAEAERDAVILDAGKAMEDDRETIAALMARAEQAEQQVARALRIVEDGQARSDDQRWREARGVLMGPA